MTDKTRSIHIEHTDGGATLVENIPDNAKITYGPVQPGRNGYGSDNVLRIYTSASNQLAVFQHVASFRDLSLNVQVREITSTVDGEEVRGPGGLRRKSAHAIHGRFVPVPPPFG